MGHPPFPLAPMVPLVNGHCSTQKKQRYPILKSQRLQKKFAPPGKSTQTALQNIEKGKISHIKKPEASKEVRPSWKKHPKGRYHMRIVDPFCNKSHPKEEISNTCCRPSFAWNKHPKGRYHTRIVDPFCCKSHPKEEISNTCCRPYTLTPLPFLVFLWMGRGAPTFSYRDQYQLHSRFFFRVCLLKSLSPPISHFINETPWKYWNTSYINCP